MKPSHWSDLPVIETGRGVNAPIFRLKPDVPCDLCGCRCVVTGRGVLIDELLGEDDGPYLRTALMHEAIMREAERAGCRAD